MIVRFEEFARAENEGNRDIVNNLLEFAGLSLGNASNDQLEMMVWHGENPINRTRANALVKNQKSYLKPRAVNKQTKRKPFPRAINSTDHREWPHHARMRGRKISRKLEWKRKEIYSPMPRSVREYLKLLYLPFNHYLSELFGQDWRDVWIT